MMVALFVYAYAIGVRSSRAIERRCRDDVAFRVITANQAPITPRSRASASVTRPRSQSCSARCWRSARAAAWSVSASSRSTARRSRLRRRITRRAAMSRSRGRFSRRPRAIDAAEDELFGEARGDELPEGLRTSGDRRKLLREAKQALEAERAAQAKKVPRDRGERLVECRRRLRQDWELERHVIAEHAAWQAAGIASDGSRRMVGARHNIKPYPLPEPAGKINVTDPDSRNLKTTRGWVQGYNAQAVVGDGQIVLAAEISTESLDTANLQPMVETALRRARARRASPRRPGSCWPTPATGRTTPSRRSVAQGIPTLVAPDADRRKEPRPGRRGGLYDFARRVLATDPAKSSTCNARARRTRLRSDQSQPRRQPLPAPRPISRQIRMAAVHRHPQPAQAPPPPARHRLRPGGPTAPARNPPRQQIHPDPRPQPAGGSGGCLTLCDSLRRKE